MSVTFEGLCRQLMAEGIKPTPTEFAKRGWPYVIVASDRYYSRDRRPIAVPGSGTTWTQGRYAAQRRELLLEFGYVFVPHVNARFDAAGRWVKPTQPKGA